MEIHYLQLTPYISLLSISLWYLWCLGVHFYLFSIFYLLHTIEQFRLCVLFPHFILTHVFLLNLKGTSVWEMSRVSRLEKKT